MSAASETRRDLPAAYVTPARDDSSNVAAMLHLAIERGVPVEALEKLVALHERVADRAAAAEFNRAMAEFQTTCPPIPKESTATIVSETKGTKFSYSYAELDTIAETVRPHLHKLGLSYSWDSEVNEATVTCTCTLRHANGHSITAKFAAPVDSAARMNATQRHAAALSYARRQSLVQVLGLTTTEPDPDGDSGEVVSADQVSNLESLIQEVKADRVRFLKYLGVSSLCDVRASRYASAVVALEAKRRKA